MALCMFRDETFKGNNKLDLYIKSFKKSINKCEIHTRMLQINPPKPLNGMGTVYCFGYHSLPCLHRNDAKLASSF